MPTRPARPCRRCYQLTEPGSDYCANHQTQRSAGWARHNEGLTSGQRGYGASWRRLRDLVLRESPTCEVCKADGRLVPATTVDHRQPKELGGTDDRANLRSLCTRCHRSKTGRDRFARPKGVASLEGAGCNGFGRSSRLIGVSGSFQGD